MIKKKKKTFAKQMIHVEKPLLSTILLFLTVTTQLVGRRLTYYTALGEVELVRKMGLEPEVEISTKAFLGVYIFLFIFLTYVANFYKSV